MSETPSQTDIKSLPAAERIHRFRNIVHAIGISVGGTDEEKIREFGEKIIISYFPELDDKPEEKIGDREIAIMDVFYELNVSSNYAVLEALDSILIAELKYF